MDRPVCEPFPDSKLLGMVRAIDGIRDAVAIIHGKSCCHADTLLFKILTGNHNDVRVTGSGIRTQDISIGGYRKLPIAIRSAYEEFKPSLIAVLVTSFTAMMGDDVDGIIDGIKEEIPCRICSFFCPGFLGDLASGYEEFLDFLFEFVEENRPENNLINIVGYKKDDPNAEADLEEIKRILSLDGVKINVVFLDCLFNEVKFATKASLNVLISEEGRNFCMKMKERFGTPFVRVRYPFGINGTVSFLESIERGLNVKFDRDIIEREKGVIKERLQKIYAYLEGIYGLPVAVIGDGSRAVDLCSFLSEEFGFEIRLLCIKGGKIREEELSKLDAEDVVIEKDQFQVEKLIRSKDIAILFGSSLEKRICRELNIPLFRIFYPVLDQIFITQRPYLGFAGTLNLVEEVVNAIIGEAR